MKKLVIAVFATLLVASVQAPAADFGKGAEKPFQLELGGAWDSFDTQASLMYTGGRTVSGGATIDFEKLLDIPVMKQHLRFSGDWRVSRKGHIQVGYENIRREGARVIDEQISWGEISFAANARIDGRFNSDEVYLGYLYDAWRADNVRLGFSIGISYYDFDTGLAGQGTATLPDGSQQTGQFDRGFGIKAPVPVLGISGEGAVSSKVTFGFHVRTLFISTANISGGTLQAGMKLKWYFLENFGLGGSVDYTGIQIKKWVSDNRNFTAKYTFAGPAVFAIVAF